MSYGICRVVVVRHVLWHMQGGGTWYMSCGRKPSVLKKNQNILINRRTLDLLYKVIVRSIKDYAPPVFANNLKVAELARMDI